MPPLQYNTLDPGGTLQIRLLRVSARRHRPVECTLETFDHSQCPNYEALSYAWGAKSETETIILNGGTLKDSSESLNVSRQGV